MMAMVDHLAAMLSERTGTKFEVLRGRIKHADTTVAMRYALRATRDDVSYQFQAMRPMKLDELTRWLATINDMVNMGFIRVLEKGEQ